MAAAEFWCSFCGRSKLEAKLLVQAPHGLKPCICDKCIQAAFRTWVQSSQAKKAV